MLKELACFSPARSAELDALLDWKYRAVLGRLGGSGAGSYAYPFVGQYTLPYAPKLSADWNRGSGPWYANWGEVARAMGLSTQGENGQALSSGYPVDAGGYISMMMPALALAVDQKIVGASEAWDRFKSASNFAAHLATFNDAPVWGVVPRGNAL